MNSVLLSCQKYNLFIINNLHGKLVICQGILSKYFTNSVKNMYSITENLIWIQIGVYKTVKITIDHTFFTNKPSLKP